VIYIGYKIKVDVPGIDQAPEIYGYYIEKHLVALGHALQEEIRSEQRRYTGEEQANTKGVVERFGAGAGFSFRLRLYNTKVQALVDETGARPHFPPWQVGTKLWKWVRDHGLGQDTSRGESRLLSPRESRALGQLQGKGAAKAQRERVNKQITRVSFLIARAISRRGLPRPGDPIRAPFKDVMSNRKMLISESFTLPFALATARINSINRRGGEVR
jgi:hypothetical protein